MGIIDETGKKLRKAKGEEEKNIYTPFHRLVYNIKRLIPGGKIGSYASALYLIKEDGNLSEKSIEKIMKELGWEPSLQFAEGLEKTVDWYLENEKWLNDVTSGDYQKYYEKNYAGR